MRLDGLAKLYNDMKANDIKRYKFIFSYNNVIFDVFFFVDEQPFKLAFGVKAENFYFELEVNRGFIINPNIGDKYLKLIEVLGLKYNPQSPFKTIHFFSEFNQKVPQNADKKNKWQPHDTAYYKKNVEESEKIYFCGWFDNEKVGKHVKPKNLEKTKEVLGNEAYEMCSRKNISSCWTADKSSAIEFFLP